MGNNSKDLLQQLILLSSIGKASGGENNKKLSELKSKLANQIGKKISKTNNRNYENRYYRNQNTYLNSSGRSRRVPEPTPFYNQALRRFLYRPSVGFYIIIGLDRNGKAIKKRVPGHFYYRYDEKLARIVPFRRRIGTRPVPKPRGPGREKRNNNNNNKRN